MLNRLFLAFVGGSLITIGMFLGMSEIVEMFNQRDPTRYFQVDFIQGPGGRRLPNLPLPESQPSRATLDRLTTDDPDIEAAPSFTPSEALPSGPRLQLDEPGGE